MCLINFIPRLFFEIARAAEQIKPRTLFLENVRGLLSHDKGRTFRTIISTLDELGYDAEWQILNSKNFGVPQNRERVFIIGHLRGERGREVFPITRENSGAIDVVNKESGMPRETNRVYSSEGLSPTLNTMQGGGREPKIAIPVLTPDRAEKRQNGRRFKDDGEPMFTITAQDRHGVILSGNINPSGNGMNGNVYDSDGLAPTLTTNKGEGPKIVQKPRGYNKGGEHEVAPTLSSNSWHENNLLKLGGLYTNASENHQRGVLPGLSRTLKSQNHDAGIFDGIRIRKLTPRECWRLKGFPDWAFNKAQDVNSNSQLYKQAGNSVTVPVIYEIARRFE